MSVEKVANSLISLNPKLDKEFLLKVISFVIKAHEGQFRKSGEPYIKHPIEVAKILAGLGLDTEIISAALLHDIVEDTKYSTKNLQEMFGIKIAEMVDGVTKIEYIQKQKGADNTAETFKKFLTFISKHPQIITIKLADRLNNMRTLEFLSPERQKVISEDTLNFYAPLAARIGLNEFKLELEDLAFKFLYPEKYKVILEYLNSTAKERDAYINYLVFTLGSRLNLENISCSVKGRSKNIYSIFQKMENRNCRLDEVFDIFAIRIITESKDVSDCYKALYWVHDLWMPIYTRFKDYIAAPKPNFYQSLHTTVLDTEKKHTRLIEVQIRTKDMNETAEHGMAAHWAYKYNVDEKDVKQKLGFLEKLTKEPAQEISNSKEFLMFLHESLLPEDIYAFTPGGKKIFLPYGATVLDFAFAVDTNTGLRCLGARSSEGKILRIDHVISNGETIDILQSDSEPQEVWLSIAQTTRAQNAIKEFLRKSFTKQSIDLGKKIWEKELLSFKMHPKDYPISSDICKKFSTENMDSFYENIGKAEISVKDISRFLKKYRGDFSNSSIFKLFKKNNSNESSPITIGDNERLLISYATCCNPIPGNPLKGIMVKGKGLEVHAENCKYLNKTPQEQQFSLKWESFDSGKEGYKYIVNIEAIENVSLEKDIFYSISKNNCFVKKTVFSAKNNMVKGRINLIATNSYQIKTLEQELEMISGVKKVEIS